MIVMVITIAMVGHGRGMRWLRLHYDTKSPLLHILVTTTMYIVYHPSPPSHHHCFYCLDCIEVVHYKHVFHQPRTFSDILTHDRTMFSTDRRRQNTRLLKYLGLFSSNVAYFAWILAVNIFCRYICMQYIAISTRHIGILITLVHITMSLFC